ncbi:hypothetical protein GOP47_0026653 [Adiantum capillus-veneris]|nr:hypothetical protein GOP47_0026653 [Adiantum capillus-veneris]
MAVVGNMSYEYTKIKEATDLLDRDESSGVGEQIKKSLLEYPSAEDNIMTLFDDLSLRSLAITNPNDAKGPRMKQYVELDIVAIEEHVRLHWVQQPFYDTMVAVTPAEAELTDSEGGDKKVSEPEGAYKVAAQLKVKDNYGNKVVAVSAEGMYDPTIAYLCEKPC